jgi:6,7-dimethyl-8-ribityllumazine synthase
MSLEIPESISTDTSSRSFAIVASRYNQELVDLLLDNVLKNLKQAGVREDAIELIRVPGSHEIPYTLSMLAEPMHFDCLIALGVIIAGETDHHEIIAQSSSMAIQQIAMDTHTPVINGIITATREQAEVRCGSEVNRGKEFALAALEMAEVNNRLLAWWSTHGVLENNEFTGQHDGETRGSITERESNTKNGDS